MCLGDQNLHELEAPLEITLFYREELRPREETSFEDHWDYLMLCFLVSHPLNQTIQVQELGFAQQVPGISRFNNCCSNFLQPILDGHNIQHVVTLLTRS